MAQYRQSGPIEFVQQRGAAADGHHQSGRAAPDFGSLTPGSINVGAVQRDAPQSAQPHEANWPWPSQEIQRKPDAFGIGIKREPSGMLMSPPWIKISVNGATGPITGGLKG